MALSEQSRSSPFPFLRRSFAAALVILCFAGCLGGPTIRTHPLAFLSKLDAAVEEPALRPEEIARAEEIIAGAKPSFEEMVKLANRIHAAEPDQPGAVLAACLIALETLAVSGSATEMTIARQQANDRLALLLVNCPRTKDGDLAACEFTWHGKKRLVAIAWQESDAPVRYFSKWSLASMVGVSGYRQRHVVEGLGVPLVAERENKEQAPMEKHFPPEGIIRPLTAVLHTDGELRLVFRDPFRTTTERYAERDEPLSSDITAAYGTLLARTALRQEGFEGFKSPTRFNRTMTLGTLQPYDPQKIPVVMVHGMRSSPYTWRELTNEICGDPQLRMRYQVWHYFYSTAESALVSAAEFRRQMEALRSELAGLGPAPGFDRVVLVGHSLGGLLCRTLVTDSGEELVHAGWKGDASVFDRLPPGDIDVLTNALHFKAKPWVSRVVFISTPHRGSSWSDNWVGRWISDSIDLPKPITDVWEELSKLDENALPPFLHDLVSRRKASSVVMLSPHNPVLRRLAELPVSPRIPFHSIMGDRGLGGGGAASDGVVTYASAHLEGAASEKIVPSGHNAQASPEGVAEVLRILHLNLDEQAASATEPIP